MLQLEFLRSCAKENHERQCHVALYHFTIRHQTHFQIPGCKSQLCNWVLDCRTHKSQSIRTSDKISSMIIEAVFCPRYNASYTLENVWPKPASTQSTGLQFTPSWWARSQIMLRLSNWRRERELSVRTSTFPSISQSEGAAP